jgi:hypothetical protein
MAFALPVLDCFAWLPMYSVVRAVLLLVVVILRHEVRII